MATATSTNNTSPCPSSPLSASGRTLSPASRTSLSTTRRAPSIAANDLFRPHRVSSRTSDLSLDLTLSSGATLSRGSYTNSSDYSYSLNSSHSSFSIHTGGSKWGNYSVKFRARNFVAKRLAPLDQLYQIGELLGEGGYGEVYRCVHLESGQERAVKVIPKDELQQSNEEVVKEFDILKDCDHPNLLKVYECLEDAHNFYIVSDIITGGELYDELDRCGNLSEEDAKVLMRVLLTCINYCHGKGLVHRDLKPENILLEQNRDFHQLKVIDFGLAASLPQQSTKEQYALTDIEGSKYYMSPQVLEGHYSSKCDVWSCGVIAFIMMGGYAPFDGESDDEIHQAVLEGQFDFDDAAWDDVSEDAKEFIMALLTYEEEARPTAEEILSHPWLQSLRKRTPDRRRRASMTGALNDLQNFYSANCKLKQATCAIIASQLLSKQETEEIDEVFRSLDVSCRGALSKDDLKRSYQDVGDDLTEQELNDLLKQVNFSGSGAIEYSEFVIATLLEKDLIDDEKLQSAFNYFDKEGKGFISPQNLKEVLQIDDERGDAYVTKKIIAQVDKNGNGLIDFEEFKNMMFSRNIKRLSVKRSSLRRSSFNRKMILEGLDEGLETDDESENEDKVPPLSPCHSPSSRRSHLPVRPTFAPTVFEETEEDCYDDSATEEDDLFETDIGNTTTNLEELKPEIAVSLTGKRRKARSFLQEKGSVDAGLTVSLSS